MKPAHKTIYLLECPDEDSLQDSLRDGSPPGISLEPAILPLAGSHLTNLAEAHASRLGLAFTRINHRNFLELAPSLGTRRKTAKPRSRHPKSSVIVALGEAALSTASYWGKITSLPSIISRGIRDTRRQIEKSGARNAVIIVSPEYFTSSAMVELNRSMFGGPDFGIVPCLEEDLARFQAVKSVLNAWAAWNPTEHFHYMPMDPFSGTHFADDRIWLGGSGDYSAVRDRLTRELGLLSIQTHSNGAHAFLGNEVVMCSNLAYPSVNFGTERLLPCFHGAECNKGAASHFFSGDLRSKILVIFACGGQTTLDSTFIDPLNSLSHQIFANGYIEGFFSSFWIHEGRDDQPFSTISPFLLNPTLGKAASAFRKWLRENRPNMADAFLLWGDPTLPIPQDPGFTAPPQSIAWSKREAGIHVTLKKGRLAQIKLKRPSIPGRRRETIAVYGDDPQIPFSSLRGNIYFAEQDAYLTLLSTETDISDIKIRLSSTSKVGAPLKSFLGSIYRNLHLSQHYIESAKSQAPELPAAPLNALLQSLKNEALKLASNLFEQFGNSLVDGRLIQLSEKLACNALHLLHRTMLEWQASFVWAKGSQIQKNWEGVLMQASRRRGVDCRYCGAETALTEYRDSLDAGLRRHVISCLNCWTVADLTDPSYPAFFGSPDHLVPGSGSNLVFELKNRWRFPLVGAVQFILEDFQPGGPLSFSSEAISFHLPQGESKTVATTFPLGAQAFPGQHVLSANYCINGSLNVLRRHVEVLKKGAS